MKAYKYAAVSRTLMSEISLLPMEEGAYVSKSLHSEKVQELLDSGYRWVRTEEDFVILELEVPDPVALAAPDLLTALQLFMEQYYIPGDPYREGRPEIIAALAAIAKATPPTP